MIGAWLRLDIFFIENLEFSVILLHQKCTHTYFLFFIIRIGTTIGSLV